MAKLEDINIKVGASGSANPGGIKSLDMNDKVLKNLADGIEDKDAVTKSQLDSIPGGTGDVTGPEASVNNNVAGFDGVTGKIIKDLGVYTDGTVKGPAASVSGNIATFKDATGKLLSDGGIQLQTSGVDTEFLNATGAYSTPPGGGGGGTGDVTGPSSSADGDLALFNATTGKVIKTGGGKATGVQVILGTNDDNYVTPKALADGDVPRIKASGDNIDTGTNDTEYATPKAIKDSKIVKGTTTSVAGNIPVYADTTGKNLRHSGVPLLNSGGGTKSLRDDGTYKDVSGGGSGGVSPVYELSMAVRSVIVRNVGQTFSKAFIVPYINRDRRLNGENNITNKAGIILNGALAASKLFESGGTDVIKNESKTDVGSNDNFSSWTVSQTGKLIVSANFNMVWDSNSDMNYPHHGSTLRFMLEYVHDGVSPRHTIASDSHGDYNYKGLQAVFYDYDSFNVNNIIFNVTSGDKLRFYAYFYSNEATTDGPYFSGGVPYHGAYLGAGSRDVTHTPSVMNFKLYA